MSNYSACKFIKKYTRTIYPIVNKQLKEYSSLAENIKIKASKANAIEALAQNRFDAVIMSTCSLYPNVDIELATNANVAFLAIVQYVNSICKNSSVNTEAFLKLVLSALKDSVNIDLNEPEKYFLFYPFRDDNGYLIFLVQRCIHSIRQLPNYEMVREYIDTYLTLYIELQVLKYTCEDVAHEINMFNWGKSHGKKYSELSSWEYCMSNDSSLYVNMMLALATDENLDIKTIEDVDKVFFPWICGIHKILDSYLDYNENLTTGQINFVFYYSHLKEYEERVSFFINKIMSDEFYNNGFNKFILRLLVSMYLSSDKANEGMNRITSKQLLKSGGVGIKVYYSFAKILRSLKYL